MTTGDGRPGKIALRFLKSMMDTGKAWFDNPRNPTATDAPVGTTPLGWDEGNKYLYLEPSLFYEAITDVRHDGFYASFNENKMLDDLNRLGYITSEMGRNTIQVKIFGQVRRVVKLRKSALLEFEKTAKENALSHKSLEGIKNSLLFPAMTRTLELTDSDLWGLYCVLMHAILDGYANENVEWATAMTEKINGLRGLK